MFWIEITNYSFRQRVVSPTVSSPTSRFDSFSFGTWFSQSKPVPNHKSDPNRSIPTLPTKNNLRKIGSRCWRTDRWRNDQLRLEQSCNKSAAGLSQPLSQRVRFYVCRFRILILASDFGGIFRLHVNTYGGGGHNSIVGVWIIWNVFGCYGRRWLVDYCQVSSIGLYMYVVLHMCLKVLKWWKWNWQLRIEKWYT